MSDASGPAIGSLSLVAVRLGATLAGLALAFAIVIGAFIVSTVVSVNEPAAVPAPRATAVATPPASVPVPATLVPVPVAAAATPAPTTAPTAAPAPPAVVAIPYSHALGNYVALNVRAGTAFAAPLAGTIQIQLWQYVNGQILQNANDSTRPVFPYIRLVAGDRLMIYRVGALTKDTELLVQNGATVKVGDPLFRVVGSGSSSWSTFYDDGMSSQVLVSLVSLSSGRELDPLPFLPLK
ncbi:MAG: hypothetical protein EXR61_06040 [Chloroflexi bacterium]|nr:hypothetical protein [Chloroflexota bacterium]